MMHIDDFKLEPREKEQYICRFCGERSRWFSPEEIDLDKVPSGWKYDKIIGLRCKRCVKEGRTE